MKFATVEIDPHAWAQMGDDIRRDFLRLHKRSMAENGYFAVYLPPNPHTPQEHLGERG